MTTLPTHTFKFDPGAWCIAPQTNHRKQTSPAAESGSPHERDAPKTACPLHPAVSRSRHVGLDRTQIPSLGNLPSRGDTCKNEQVCKN